MEWHAPGTFGSIGRAGCAHAQIVRDAGPALVFEIVDGKTQSLRRNGSTLATFSQQRSASVAAA